MSIGCISEFWQHMKDRRHRQPLHDRDVWVENRAWHTRDIVHPLRMRGVICAVAQNSICLLLFQMLSDVLPDFSQTAEDGARSKCTSADLTFFFLFLEKWFTAACLQSKKKSERVFKSARSITAAPVPGSLKLRSLLMLRASANKGTYLSLWN